MNNTLDDRKKFILWAHAKVCFENCINACKTIEELRLDEESNHYKALSQWAVIEYTKPFKKNIGVSRLENEIIPQENRQTHDFAINIRDKVFAHIDLADDNAANLNDNSVCIEITEHGDYDVLISDTRITQDKLNDIHQLACILFENANNHMIKLIDKIMINRSQPGRYEITIERDEKYGIRQLINEEYIIKEWGNWKR